MVSKQRQIRHWLSAVSLILGMVLMGTQVHAQMSTTGRIDGVVTDESGAAMPGVNVTVRNVDTGIYFETVTNQRGEFRFLAVPARPNYELTAAMPGFANFRATDITVSTGSNQRFVIELRVASIEETVTVTGESPMVDVRSVVSKEEIGENTLDNIPLIQRNFTEIGSIFPGVQYTPGESTALTQFHVRGHATRGHGYNQDGAELSSPFLGRSGAALSMNAVEKFEFLPGGFQAEFGEHQGGYINIVTKSGSNQISGSYSGLIKPDTFSSALDSGISGQIHEKTPGTTWFQEVALGGALIRDKFWYFGAFQLQNKEYGNILSYQTKKSRFYNNHLKLTYFQDPKNQWNFVLNANPVREDNTSLSDVTQPSRQNHQFVNIYLAHIKQQHTFNPDTVLESQFYYKGLKQWAPPMIPDVLPQVNLYLPTGTTYVGTPGTYSGWNETSLRGSAKLTKYWASHLMKLGVDVTFIGGFREQRQDRPVYYDRRPIGRTLNRYYYDYPGNEGSEFYPLMDNRQLSFYLQDSWTVNDSLTLDYGVRMDWERVVGEFRPAPRFGFSYALPGESPSKIYGNTGIYYGWIPGSYVYLWDQSPRSQTLVLVTGTGDFPDPSGVHPEVKDLSGNETILNVFSRVSNPLTQPYTISWSLGYERELPGAFRLGAAVTGNKQRNSEIFTRYSDRDELEMAGEIDYIGVELTVRKRMTQALDFMAAYTWSQNEGDTNSTLTELQAPYRYARMDWDMPHAFTFSGVSTLPYDLELSGVFRFMSGRPYSIVSPDVGTAVQYVDLEGNPAGRNIYRMNAFSSLDLSFGRVFTLGGNNRLKPYVQVFNTFNRLSELSVRTDFNSAGRPSQVAEGRQIQIGFDFYF